MHVGNAAAFSKGPPALLHVMIQQVEEAARDAMGSFVGHKGQQRWRWHASDPQRGTVLAYVFGSHTDAVCVQWKKLLAPFGLLHLYTDDWGAYQRHILPAQHTRGKQHTQKIERKHLTLRTRIKRLARKTICLAFPISAFGVCSCGFLVHPLRKCFEFKSFRVYKAPVMFQTEDDLFHRQSPFTHHP
jgi:insertion element IS1 protein InsB